MCRCLCIQPSGFYAWQKSPLSQRAREDARQTELIRRGWNDSGKVYGYRKLHVDDAPVPMLVPGKGKTAQTRLWAYVVDDRPSGATTPAQIWYRFTPDCSGIHAQTELRPFAGLFQADGYDGDMTSSTRAAVCGKPPAARISYARSSRIIRRARRS